MTHANSWLHSYHYITNHSIVQIGHDSEIVYDFQKFLNKKSIDENSHEIVYETLEASLTTLTQIGWERERDRHWPKQKNAKKKMKKKSLVDTIIRMWLFFVITCTFWCVLIRYVKLIERWECRTHYFSRNCVYVNCELLSDCVLLFQQRFSQHQRHLMIRRTLQETK